MKRIWVYFAASLAGLLLGFLNVRTTIDYLVRTNSERQVAGFDGWSGNLAIARDDQGTLLRAIVARIGLGANTKEEAIYLTKIRDANGDRLNSAHAYTIQIAQSIPVAAYWSITLYGEDDYLIHNEAGKHAVSSFHDLHTEPDGAILIVLSKDQPDSEANWIPLPGTAQNLTLTLRCYHPKEEMLTSIESIDFPVVQRLRDVAELTTAKESE